MELKVLLLVLIIHNVKSQLISSLLQFWGEGTSMLGQETIDQRRLEKAYDFIIVGAGSAGCVMANRLSENPDWNVLLIEAGDSENLFMDIPSIVHLLQRYEVNWGYKTEPSEEYCLGMKGKQCNWPRGKVMGGSSVLNYMIYTRGNPQDYDNWAAMGNEGWNYSYVLPYFKKLENSKVKNVKTDKNYRSRGGPLTITDDFFMSPIGEKFVAAGVEYGLPNVDYNGPTQVGASKIQSNLKKGYRQSANVAYLYPIHDRPNLHVKKRSHVTNLVIDENSKRVLGVTFQNKGKTYSIKARREVIVSAGAINSPQLLMLSGIGPADHLRQVGIKSIVNLPVGYNLMDHVAPGAVTMQSKVPGISFSDVIGLFNVNFVDFVQNHRGPMTGPGGCESVIFADTLDQKNMNGYPDIELLQLAGTMTSFPTFRENFGIDTKMYDKVFSGLNSDSHFMVFPIILRPTSKGRVMLKSRNPFKYPLLYPNYFSNETDLQTAVRGIRLLQNLLKTNVMRKAGVKFVQRSVPGCEKYGFDSDKYWECYTRMFPFTIYHYR